MKGDPEVCLQCDYNGYCNDGDCPPQRWAAEEKAEFEADLVEAGDWGAWRSVVGWHIHSDPYPPIIRTPVMGAGCNWIGGWLP